MLHYSLRSQVLWFAIQETMQPLSVACGAGGEAGGERAHAAARAGLRGARGGRRDRELRVPAGGRQREPRGVHDAPRDDARRHGRRRPPRGRALQAPRRYARAVHRQTLGRKAILSLE